jgi:hypothetical protein
MSTETQIPEGYMQDAKGRLWPEGTIKEVIKLEDQLVKKIMGYADDLSAQIARFKGHTFDDVAAFMDLLAEEYDTKKGGKKGNVSFTSFDGLTQVRVQVQDYLTFSSELQIAKDLIDECINEWAEGSRDEIRAMVNLAFNVEKEGQVNRAALFGLRTLSIEHEKWKKAMDAINNSIRVAGSKTYVRFYRRKTAEDKWKAIPIDLAAV